MLCGSSFNIPRSLAHRWTQKERVASSIVVWVGARIVSFYRFFFPHFPSPSLPPNPKNSSSSYNIERRQAEEDRQTQESAYTPSLLVILSIAAIHHRKSSSTSPSRKRRRTTKQEMALGLLTAAVERMSHENKLSFLCCGFYSSSSTAQIT